MPADSTVLIDLSTLPPEWQELVIILLDVTGGAPASTKGIASTDESVYNYYEDTIQNLTSQRDALASQIKAAFDNAAFNGHMDDIDRSSKAFQNYQLDRSVVRDNDYAERGTVSNSYADSLVRANPDRFQIIQNQDLIKGIDY